MVQAGHLPQVALARTVRGIAGQPDRARTASRGSSGRAFACNRSRW
jgi:hypothetical protein